MELSADQLQTLASTATDPGSLEHTLLTKFPDATISVVRGLDRFAMETYTHGAYFSEAVAREVMVAIPPNSSPDLADVSPLLSGRVRELHGRTPSRSFIDQRTQQPLDHIDRQMVYASLFVYLTPESSAVGR